MTRERGVSQLRGRKTWHDGLLHKVYSSIAGMELCGDLMAKYLYGKRLQPICTGCTHRITWEPLCSYRSVK